MNQAAIIEDPPVENTANRYPNAYMPVVPNGQICSVTGLRHAKLYHLLGRGEASKHVRTVILKEPGAARGKLLFHVGDMLRWLDGLAEAQAAERKAEQGQAAPNFP